MTAIKNEHLVVTGVGIAGATFSGMDQFGYEIYRGKKYSGNSRLLTLPDSLKSALEQAANMGDLHLFSVAVMNSQLLELVKSAYSTINVIDLSSHTLYSAFLQITKTLGAGETEIILAIDLADDSDAVSALTLTLPSSAEKSGSTTVALISLSSVLNRKKTEVLTVNGKLPEFIQNPAVDALAQLKVENGQPKCALTDSSTGLFSVLKLLTCMKNRMIPAVSGWNGIDPSGHWSASGFYVPVNSRSWFTPVDQPDRFGSVVSFSDEGDLAYINLHMVDKNQSEPIILPSMEDMCLFPFGGNSHDEIIQQLAVFKNTNFTQTNLHQAARFQFRRWLKNNPHKYSACILGSTPEELLREIEYALTGIPDAAGKASDWRTPAGSTFSPEPLGNTGSIAFVYPGAFNSYIGVGQDLFRLFPPLYQRLTDISSHIGDLLNEHQLYPRRFAPILPEDQELLEKQLVADPLAMLISGTCLAAVYTFLLRETFDIHPASSLGYSLGEISMMFASGVWTKADETALALRQSPLFHNRLAGTQDAVREYWGKTGTPPESADGRLWANFILMASYEKVAEAIKNYPHVYVTHINTPRQVVIGGAPDECRQLIATLKCSSLEAPFNYALHCAAMESEFEALRELHTWPVQNQPGMTLYSAATDSPMPIGQESIARQIAYGLCHQLDFPKLVDTAYKGGARIFIELGAGSNCTRWVDESLAGKPHTAFSINRKGVDDHSAILQMLARLITHGAPVNLSPIFG